MTIFFRLLNLCSIGSGVLLYYYHNFVGKHIIFLIPLLIFLFGLSFLSWFTKAKTTYTINDVPYALRAPILAIYDFISHPVASTQVLWFFLLIAVLAISLFSFADDVKTEDIVKWLLIIVCYLCCLGMGLFLYNYSRGITIDVKNNLINFPAKNKLATFADFITLRFLLGQFFRRTVKFTDIQYIHSEIKSKGNLYEDRTVKTYYLNCAGKFGSFNLAFSSMQKRDEAIAIIKQAAKDLNHKIEFRNILY